MSAISGNPNDRRSKNVSRAGIDVVANSKVAVKRPAPSVVAATAAAATVQQTLAQTAQKANLAEKAAAEAVLDQMDDGMSESSHGKSRDKDAKKKGHSMAATLKGLFKPKR